MDTDPYWDSEIGTATIDGEPYAIRLKLHESREPYTESQEIVPVARRGERVYFHAEAYLLTPDIHLTVELTGRTPEGAIGHVRDAEYTGVRPLEIGDCQGWYYPADRTLILWECVLGDRHRREDPTHDPLLHTLWEGFERSLLERAPDARRIVTPNWEPLYEQPAWRQFLSGQGYEPVTERAFGKEVERAAQIASDPKAD
jgi:hypothetical protein